MSKLYLILAKEVGRVKIGFSKEPTKRLEQLKIGSPVELELFAFKKDNNAKVSEGELHEKYKDKKVHGEWYDLEPIDYINILKNWNYDIGIHFSKRTQEDLKVGELAFISWDSRSLCKVEVTEIDNVQNRVSVKILSKIGRGTGNVGSEYSLYPDEVRKHPIDALINRVTS